MSTLAERLREHASHLAQANCAAEAQDLRAAADALDAAGWRPIATAPHGRDMFVVRAFAPNAHTDAYCVWRTHDGGFARWPHIFDPTHWTPLPAPPT
jgi:hypothetical protein